MKTTITMSKALKEYMSMKFYEYVCDKAINNGIIPLDDDMPDLDMRYAEDWEAETGIPLDSFYCC